MSNKKRLEIKLSAVEYKTDFKTMRKFLLLCFAITGIVAVHFKTISVQSTSHTSWREIRPWIG